MKMIGDNSNNNKPIIENEINTQEKGNGICDDKSAANKPSFMVKIKSEFASFLEAISKASEPVYLVLLTLYVSIYFILNIAWAENISEFVYNARYVALSIVMWGTTLYLFFVIAAWKSLWKRTLPLILTGVVLLFATGFFATKMSTNSYGVVFDLLFCILACGKNFKKILHCILGVFMIGLITAGIGERLGFTYDVLKPNYISETHSLGIIYPNTWGSLVFIALLILWYLYLRHKPWFTFPLFWSISYIMFTYISCNTIAGFTAMFPVGALIIDVIERGSDKKAFSSNSEHEGKKIGFIGWLVILIPFFAFAFMMFASMQVEFLHDNFYYTRLHNFAMRFVQGGLYFRTYGLPIFGNPYRSNVITYVNVNGDFLQVGILDSSFAAYIIMRGMVWLGYTLTWLSIAHWKALKKRDYAIPYIETIMLGFAMMERPGLEMWYNFILLYPLAKVVSKAGTELKFEKMIYDGVDSVATDDVVSETVTEVSTDEHLLKPVEFTDDSKAVTEVSDMSTDNDDGDLPDENTCGEHTVDA